MIYVRYRFGGLPEVPSLLDEVFHSSMILLRITAWCIGVNLSRVFCTNTLGYKLQ